MLGRTAILKIIAAHGIRGAVKVWADFSGWENLPLYFADGEPVKIRLSGMASGLFIIFIDGVNDRNAAEELRGTFLYADAEIVAEMAHDPLVGLPVSAGGLRIGEVLARENFGAGDVFSIALNDGTERMIAMGGGGVLVLYDTGIEIDPEHLV